MTNPNREAYERAKAALEKAQSELNAVISQMQTECDHPFESVAQAHECPAYGCYHEINVCTLCGYSEFWETRGYYLKLTRYDYRRVDYSEALKLQIGPSH
jgi:hypothetical protein